jgi:hypothetical protein
VATTHSEIGETPPNQSTPTELGRQLATVSASRLARGYSN